MVSREELPKESFLLSLSLSLVSYQLSHSLQWIRNMFKQLFAAGCGGTPY